MKTFKVNSASKTYTVKADNEYQAIQDVCRAHGVNFSELSAMRIKTKDEKALPKNAQIVVFGRRWFDKVNGNTYHSAEVWVNGKFVGRTGSVYGYHDAYMETGLDLLKFHFFIPTRKKFQTTLFSLSETHNANVITSVADVASKKNL